MGYLEARVTKYSNPDKFAYDEVLNGWLNLQYTDEVNGPGSGQVTLPVLDAKVQSNLALLDDRNIVTVLRGGAVEGRFIVQSRELVMANGASNGDMADRVWVVSGEGLRTLTHDAVVFPENGSVNSTTPSNRNFNFGTVTKSRWYNSSQWKAPVVGPKYLAKGSVFGKWPTSWPITNGNWIWGNSGINSHNGYSPNGTCYFRGEFTVSKQGLYSFYAAADDSMEIYVDGAMVASTAPGHSSWDTTTSSTGIKLDPGNHVFAAKVFNRKGRGGFIGCVRREADPGATVTSTTTKKLKSGKSKTTTTTKAATATTVMVTGDSHWKVCAYPTQEPGWTPGEVMLQLWSEAKARGVEFPNYLVPNFTANHDSYGKPWPGTTTYSFNTNQEYFDVISTIEGLIADIYFDPRDYSFNMYAQQGVDHTVDLGNTFAPYATLVPGSTAADAQCMLRVPETGHYFVSQPHTEPDGKTQSTRITRLDSTGKMMEQMVLNGAGHGTSIAVQVSGGVEFVWVTWSQPSLTDTKVDNNIVRFPWSTKVGTAGTRYDRSQVAGLTTMIPGGGFYRNIQFDWQNNWALLRVSGGSSDQYQRHSISNILSGDISSPSGVIHLTQSTNFGLDGHQTCQGFATYKDSLFRWTGAPNTTSGGDPFLLTEYRWIDASVVRTVSGSGLDTGASVREPEGATLYDIDGSNPLLLVGVVTGPAGTHGFDLFSLPLQPNSSGANPPALRLGQNVTSADETSVGAIKNGLLVQTNDGWVYKTDNNSLAKYGRIEGGASVSSNTDQSGAVINQTFKLLSNPTVSTTYQVHDDSVFLPGSDFRCGDWILAPNMLSPSDSALTKRRVMSITYSADTTNFLPNAVYAVELDTIYQDRVTVLNRLIQRLNNSSSVTSAATSTATGGSTGAGDSGGTSGGSGGSSNALSIDPPGNFSIEDNVGTFDVTGSPITQLDIDWDPPIDDDGSSQDVAYYEVYGSSPTADWGLLLRTELNVVTIELPVSQTWTLAVRAIAAWDTSIVSDFSITATITTASPLTPLDPPTQPVVTTNLGTITATWDGYLQAPAGNKETPPPQMASVQAKIYPQRAPGSAQIMGNAMNVAGSVTITGLTVGGIYEVEFVATDNAGLVSAPSSVTEVTVAGVDLGSLDADLQKIVSDKKSSSSVFSDTPPGSDWYRDGVLWFDTAHGNAISRWDAASSAWVPVPYGEGALGPDSITERVIAAQSIYAGALQAGSVLADSIEASAVTTEKLEAGSVTADKIAADAITANSIAAGAITSEMLTVGAAPVPTTDRVANQPTDYGWWHDYALPLLATGKAGIPNWTYSNENNRVTSVTGGLQFDTTTGQRALVGLTAMYPVPDSRQITVSWAGSGTLPIRVRENDPSAQNGVVWSSYGTTQRTAFTFGATTTSYGVYVEVPANSGVSLLVALHVFEVIGVAGGNGQQGVQISPAGIQLTNIDGSTRVSLGTDNSDSFRIISDDGSGNPILEIGLGIEGTATFQQGNAVNDIAIQGSNLVGGLATNLTDAQANGGTWPVGGPNDTTDMGLLDIPGRSVTYQARWSTNQGKSVSTQYYFIASNSFQVEDGRMVMLMLNNGGLAANNNSTTNIYARLQLDLAKFQNQPVSGTTVSSALVSAGSNASFTAQPTVWTTMATATTIDYVNGILPAGVQIFWQYYLDLSSVPNTSYTLNEFGQIRGLSVIDLGSNAIVDGAPVSATDNRGPSSGGGGSSGGGTTTTTKTFSCSFSTSYRNSGSTPVTGTGTYTDAKMLYQGIGASPMGAIFGFPALGLSTKTVTKVQLYLRNRSTYTGGSVTVHMKTMGNTSAPSSIGSEGSQTFSWGAGQGKWVTLPSSWFSGIGSGSTRSFQIGVDSTNGNYAYFDGYGKSDPPKLRVTYTG